MIAADIAILDDTQRLPLATWRGAASWGHGAHGFESCRVPLPLSRDQAYDLYLRLSGGLRILVTGGGAEQWEGRVEDVEIANGLATAVAFGRWRALRDSPYTAFWSTATFNGFRQSTQDDFTGARPERFFFEQAEGAYYLGPSQTGGTYAAAAANLAVGEITTETPNGGSRNFVGAQFRMQLVAANDWRFQFAATARDYTSATSVTTATVAGGVNFDIGYHLTFAARPRVRFGMLSSVSQVFAQNAGDYYVRISRLRLVSSFTNRVNTVLTGPRAAGASVTATAVTTAGMYVGMDLVMTGNAAGGEVVTVESITNATQFVATFAKSHLAGATVQGFRVLADEVVKDLRDTANALNAGALSTSDALILSPGLDVIEASYMDADMGDVATSLAALGDTSGSRYEVGVSEGRRLYFRPKGSVARQWYVALADLTLQQTLDQLYNSIYATYQRSDGFTLRTAAQDSATSQRRYSLTRRRAVQAQTANATLAARVAQTARDDTALITPRARLVVTRLQSAGGAAAPLWAARGGDTITILNLPPVYGAAIDKVRTFTILDCQVQGEALAVTPETPLPELEYQLARLAAFTKAAGGPFADVVP